MRRAEIKNIQLSQLGTVIKLYEDKPIKIGETMFLFMDVDTKEMRLIDYDALDMCTIVAYGIGVVDIAYNY